MRIRGEDVTGNGDELKIAELEPGFLAYLAARGLQRRFAGLDPAAGQLPAGRGGAFPAAPEQDLAGMRDDNGDAAADRYPVLVDGDSPCYRQYFELYVILPVYR